MLQLNIELQLATRVAASRNMSTHLQAAPVTSAAATTTRSVMLVHLMFLAEQHFPKVTDWFY